MSDRLADAARELATQLATTAPLWCPPCFYDDPAWVVTHPATAAALLALDDEALTSLETDPALLERWCIHHAPALLSLFRAAEACLDSKDPPTPLHLPEVLGRDVPGRKWQQTLAFAAACGIPRGPVVDWCCGKAHLGRLLARLHHVSVTGIERNAALCEAGRQLALRDHLPVHWHVADVLKTTATHEILPTHAHAVALHACGDLHLALIQQVIHTDATALDLAPCCYHLTRETHWHPKSRWLAQHTPTALRITRTDLRLAVQETVTANKRITVQREKMAGWRLGFDALQRELRGANEALPSPSQSARVLAEGFSAFCRTLAAHHQLSIPNGIDDDHYEMLGHARQQRVRRLQLLRHACRRPLEILLVTDRALWLAEYGYDVRLRTFCNRQLTPRNLLLQARKAA